MLNTKCWFAVKALSVLEKKLIKKHHLLEVMIKCAVIRGYKNQQ